MSAQPNTTLRHALAQHFSLDELKLLCHDAGIDSERVPYAERGRDIFAFCIVETFRKQNRLPALRSECAKARDVGVDWVALTVEETVPAEWVDLFSPKNLINTQGGAAFLGDMTVTGDVIGRDKIINYITNGLGDLPVRYDGNVRNFLSYYIGTDQQPAPFGGRATDLARLDGWLSDMAAPHYAFLAAPAGRGKSALLAHWVMRLRRRDDVHVVFFPISIRYATNRDNVAYAALAARMAHVHGERVGRANDAQEYRSVFNDFLARPPKDGKPVLVVLDGLDEAAGWEAGADLFPDPAPKHLRVLVAARTRAGDADGAKWLTQLGWEGGRARLLPLGVLDEDGVRDALQQMGNPLDALAPRYDIVRKLHELSEGDPLMVRLYVEALLPQGSRAATFAPDDLLNLKPGIKPFFDRWFDEQKKLWKGDGAQETTSRDRAVNGLLNACALAKGPLSNADMLALCAQAPSPEIAGTPDVEWAAEQVNRFVIGEGSEKQGYVFSHPRLGYYFAERLTAKEREGWRERYLRYGRETLTQLNDSTLKPKDASPYAVRYYGSHLSEAKAEPQSFYDLMNEGWLRAWEWIDGTPGGFLGDCDRAWKVVEVEGSRAIGQAVRVMLCHSSVTSQSARVSSALLVDCVRTGVLSHGLALMMARKKADLDERATSLAGLCDYAGDQRAVVLAEALSAARAIPDHKTRADVLVAMVDHVPVDQKSAALGEALAAVRGIPNWSASNQLIALRAILKHPVADDPELLESALSIVNESKNKNGIAYALCDIADRLPTGNAQRTEVMNQALKAAYAIEDTTQQAYALGTIAQSLPADQQAGVLERVFAIALSIDHDEIRSDLLRKVATTDQPNLLDRVRKAAQAIEYELYEAYVLGAVAERLPPSKKLKALGEAREAAREERDDYWRVDALTYLAERFPDDAQPGVLDEALTDACKITDEVQRAERLGKVFARLPKDQPQLLEKALGAAHTITANVLLANILHTLAARFPDEQQPERLREALQVANVIGDEADRADSLSSLAMYLPDEMPERLHEALTIVRDIKDEEERVWVLGAVAGRLPHDQPHLLSEALFIVRSIKAAISRAGALGNVVARLPHDQPHLLNEVLTLARGINDERNRAIVLSAIAARLPPEEAQRLAEMLDDVCEIKDESARSVALHAFAKQVPSNQLRLRTRVLKEARNINNTYDRAQILLAVARLFPINQQVKLLQEAWAIKQMNLPERHALVNVAIKEAHAHLSPKQLAEVLSKVLNIEYQFDDTEFDGLLNLADGLAEVADDLPPGFFANVLQQTLETAHTFEHKYMYAEALVAVANRMPKGKRPAILETARKAARSEKLGVGRVKALLAVASSSPVRQRQTILREAFEEAGHISDPEDRTSALLLVAEQWPALDQTRVWSQALSASRAIENTNKLAEKLEAMATVLPAEQPHLLEEILRVVEPNQYSFFSVLRAVAARMPLSLSLVSQILNMASRQQRPRCLKVVTAMTPAISHLGGERAVRETAQAILDTAKWWP